MILLAATELGDFFIRAGAIAAGCMAIGGSVALVVGAIARDLGTAVDQWVLATKGASLGALFGTVYALAERA